MDLRELKGLEIAARMRIVWDDDAWIVPSQTTSAKYRVVLRPAVSCQCEDFQLSQKACKHVYAARYVQERDHAGKTPMVKTEDVPKRPTYRQNWSAYNLAQTTEKDRFQVLLADLCRGVNEPPSYGGRPRTPIADVLFACVFKVYCTFSSRRFACDLNDAVGKGYMTRAMHPNKVNTHMERADLMPVLKWLVEQSSLPLKAVETVFAPDSSGFSCSRFVRWFDEKYGVHRSGHDWVKVHLMAGVKTHIITAVEILDRDANDSPLLPGMLNTTAKNFTVKEVPADKGYSSIENVEAVVAAGATPYIAFKAGTTGYAGGLWERMFHFYQYKREEFLQHYHKRSNVESVFSMIKAKFKDSVRSRTDAAMKNEALCKLLAHNLCCLIMSQCELGIEAEFWKNGEAPAGSADVLPMVWPG